MCTTRTRCLTDLRVSAQCIYEYRANSDHRLPENVLVQASSWKCKVDNAYLILPNLE